MLEHDEVKLLASLGHEVFSIGAYIHPSKPMDDKRPALDIPEHPDLIAAVDALGQQGHADTLQAAKDMGLPDAVLDWAEVIIYAAYEHRWLQPHWNRLKKKRVIWRTIGQSAHPNEWLMKPLRSEGLEIVRYSPKERNIPEYAGEDALIRFYKDPAEWQGWHGSDEVVTNIHQNLYLRSMADDGALQPFGKQWTSYSFWADATKGLPVKFAGPGSERHGGLGSLDPPDLLKLLQTSRCYVSTGTQPASYTLGLVEAGMTGIPLISIGPAWYSILPYGHLMFEAHELAPFASDDPAEARRWAMRLLDDWDYAREVSVKQREFFIATFGRDTIADKWQTFLVGAPALAAVA